MEYIVHTRFKTKAICGEVNLPALTQVELQGNTLYYQNKPLCISTSENAHKYFARNDDGQGIERGRLTSQIQEILRKRDDHYQDRWNKIWDSKRCQKYKRTQYSDFWLWNHDFFNASIEDLQYIYNLIREDK